MSEEPTPRNTPAVMSAGLAAAKIMANHASPKKRRSTQPMDALEDAKRMLALSSEAVWKTTGVPNTRPVIRPVGKGKKKKKTKKWRVHLLKYKTEGQQRGDKKQSPDFETQHAAEANLFNFRYGLESKESKALVDEYILFLNKESDKKPAAQLPAKKPRLSNSSVDSRGSCMSQNPAIRHMPGAPMERNPMVPGAFNWYNSENTAVYVHWCARQIQRNWSLKRRRRAMDRIKRTLESQTVRKRLIDQLRIKIAEKDWQALLEGGTDAEVQWSASAYDREHVLEQARAICRAIEILYEHTEANQPIEWINGCCRIASEQINTVSAYTISKWYRQFFAGEDMDDVVVVERFPRSMRGRLKSTGVRSPLDETYGDEELTLHFKQWAKENLEELSIQRAVDWMNERLDNWTMSELDNLNIELPLRPHVVAQWMRGAGFVYSQYKKSYAVNTHERPDVVAARRKYVFDYLDNEINQAVWLQLPFDAARTIFEEAMDTTSGDDGDDDDAFAGNLYWIYRHEFEEDGAKMVELPVFAFTHQQTQEFLANEDPLWQQVGGMPSVRKHPDKLVELDFGQDESAFSLHTMNESVWHVDGTRPERNKGGGTGRMVSGMQSYAFGYGLAISDEDLQRINALRDGESYADVEAASELQGDAFKKPLTGSPFSVLFDYGKGKSGYWGYRHMICQLEDCVDCLRILFPGKNGAKFLFDFTFEFDHSAGHSKQRPDGLSAGTTNIGYGGKQPKMRNSIITDAESELGDCDERILNVGDVQSFVFAEGDAPPVADPSAPRHDVVRGEAKDKEKSAAELQEELKGLGLFDLAVGKAAEVKAKAQSAGIALRKTVAPIKEGYVGKAKGLKQIVWERGFWSAAELRPKGVVKEEAMKSKLTSCFDFATELSQMQYIAKQLGVRVVMTPKAHPELAGQGIEYSWGYAKLCFRKINTARSAKEKAQLLEANVRAATSTVGAQALNIERVRKFVRKARDYKMVYREHFATLDLLKEQAEDTTIDAAESAEQKKKVKAFEKHHYVKIEKQVRHLKAHRAAADIDTKFIRES